MADVKLSSPWVLYYRKLEALFGNDPDIEVEFDEDEYEIKLYVDNISKADALSQLLPDYKAFGNLKVLISVIPSNSSQWKAHLIPEAFKGNPAFKDMQIVEGIMSNPVCYVIFKKEVVQYPSDNLGDIHQITSTLYQDIAKELIDIEGVCYCTDIE